MPSPYIYNFRTITIKTVSAACGSGKSYALRQQIKKDQQKCNHLVVLPSLVLVEQFCADLINDGVTGVKKITSETNRGKVKSAIRDYLSKCLDAGHVLVITVQAFDDLLYFKRRDNWKTFIDELPQVDSFFSVDISKNKQFITDFIELGQKVNSEIAFVRIKADALNTLKRVTKSTDDGYKSFLPFYRALLSENRDVYVDIGEWNTALKKTKADSKSGALTFLAMFNPKQFKNTTILAANIEQSLLYKWFSRFHQVKFEEDKRISDSLRFIEHDEKTGKRVELYYFLDDRKYSKYRRDTKLEGEKNVGTIMDELAVNFIGDSEFLYVTNNDYDDKFLAGNKYSTKLPVKSHGLNMYQNHTAIYFNVALNHSPQHSKLLENLGITNDDIRIANTYDNIYQCLMRTSLRDNKKDSNVRVIVPDKYTAFHLSELLGGSSVKKIDGLNLPVKPIKFTASQRNKRSKFKKITDNIFDSEAKNRPLSNIELEKNKKTQKQLLLYTYKQESNKFCNLADIENNQVAVTFHNKYISQLETEFSDYIFNTKDFIKILKLSGQTVIDTKSENFLVNAGVYDGSIDTDGFRRQENFLQSSFMILDFDNGNLSPEKFEDIFWKKAHKVEKRSFIICNSFSRSEEKPNCFRVFMFYKVPVTSINQHKIVFDDISKTLGNHGFNEKTSGLDKVCQNGIQSFYMPSINRAEQEYGFFRKHGLQRITDISKYGIDVKLIAKTKPPSELTTIGRSFEFMSTGRNYRTSKVWTTKRVDVEKTINSIQLMTENRHSPFFDAAIQFRGLGFSLNEIEQLCHLIAGTEQKMLQKVPDIMNSLRNYQGH